MDQSQDTLRLLELHRNSFDYDYRRAALWRKLSKIIPLKSKVLDAGCGTGFISYKLAKRGNEVTALDGDSILTRFIKKLFIHNNLEIRIVNGILGVGLLKKLGKFDVICCLDVLEHIENDFGALNDLKSNLRRNGKMIISVPAFPFLYGHRDEKLGHYRRYTKKNLIEIITRANMQVCEIRYWNMIGVLPYIFYEKILKREVSDNIRKPSSNVTASLLRRLLYFILSIEWFLPLPIGLSLLAICK